MKRRLIHELNPYYKIPFDILTLEKIDETLFLDSIKKKIHIHQNANYKLISISPGEIYPLTKFVYNYRLEKANKLLIKYTANSISPYSPIFLNYSNLLCQIVAPPIIEMHNNKFVLCDGTHRVFMASQKGFKKIVCMLIENVIKPLPGDINEWKNVRIKNSEVPVNQNFINYHPEYLAGYTWIFNNEKVWFEKTKTSKQILSEFAEQ